MKEVLTRWYRRYLSEEEAVILLAMLTMAFAVMLFFGDILAPVLVEVGVVVGGNRHLSREGGRLVRVGYSRTRAALVTCDV